MMFDFFGNSKKTKTADNDGCKRQETSSKSSLTECPSDNTAGDKSVQNPNESETSAASDQQEKKLKSDLF